MTIIACALPQIMMTFTQPSQPHATAKRNESEYQCPSRVIQQYNKHMGGVDLLDRFISDYRPCLHGKKWYWPLLSNTLVTLRFAAWRLYTELGSQPPLDQLHFTRLIVQGLLTKTLVTRERPGPSGALVFHSKEGHGHHLVPLGKQSRCRQCTKNTRMKCQMCSVALHIHCSATYHEGK